MQGGVRNAAGSALRNFLLSPPRKESGVSLECGRQPSAFRAASGRPPRELREGMNMQ
jgi:hypothetical protein